MILQLSDSQDCPVGVGIKDRKGNPAQVQSPTWKSSDEAIVTVGPDPADPENVLKTLVHAVGPLGSAQVTFDADADLGDGVEDIMGVLDVVVGAGKATIVELIPGTPVEQA